MVDLVTKTQLMAPVLAGLQHECFEHSEAGLFDVTAMRQWLHRVDAEKALVAHVPLSEIVDHIRAHRVTMEERVATLPEDSWREDPGIFIVLNTRNGEEHLMIDGHHRALRREREGFTYMHFYMVPEEYAIRPRPGWTKNPFVDWGDEVVGGRIVKRR